MRGDRLRVVFAGTPEFAVPCLHALLSGPEHVIGVYSQPDRPAGRGRKLTPSPVKSAAEAAGIRVFTPESLRTVEARAALGALAPDLVVVVAFGMILSPKVLAIPRLGCWNVHASLLPRWRGAAPIQRAIEAGDEQTGVCLMQMEKGLDTGPVFASLSTPIDGNETASVVHDRLAQLGARVLRQGLDALAAGTLAQPEIQAEQGVSYAHKLEKSECQLDFHQSALQLHNRVRAFNPTPIAQADIQGESVQLLATQVVPGEHNHAPGTIIGVSKFGIDLACASGVLRVTQLRRAGGKIISAADYLNARADLRALAQTLAAR